MHVLHGLLTVYIIGQACQGAVLHQGQTSQYYRTIPGHVFTEHGGESGTYPERKETHYINSRRYLRTGIKDKKMKYKPSNDANTQSGTDRLNKRRVRIVEPLPVSVEASKPTLTLHRTPHSLLSDAQTKFEDRNINPEKSHSSGVEMAQPILCNNFKKTTTNIATAPPNVCDLCPDEDGKNPLDPCTCVGVGGTGAGLISISCPSSIVSLDQLRDIFHNTNFLVNHVFQFTLQGSNANGALTRDIWGDLDFKYVSINNNKITDVDNGAFIASAKTLISLNLANNNIRNYVAVYNDLPNLLSLNLRGNNMSLIYSEDFKYPALTELDLSSNQINSIGKHSFAALKKLKSLNLSDNELTSIGDERFTFIDHDFSNALVINLSHNKISFISDTAFLGLRNVEIDLRSNQLRKLEKNIFHPIIIDSQYHAYFHFIDNPMLCDCDLLWVLQDGKILFSFDNFKCSNNDKHLYYLTISDLGNCTQFNGVKHQ